MVLFVFDNLTQVSRRFDVADGALINEAKLFLAGRSEDAFWVYAASSEC